MSESNGVLLIEDLLSTSSLALRSLAGEAGLGRSVLWAHSCEMSDPTKWLGSHELLMTVGLCVPTVPDEQADFIARLDEASIAGLILGDHDTCPPVSDEMLREADKRGFPVLLADAQTPWAAVARHIAAANTSSQTMQVLKLSKLYQIAANADDDADGLILQLSTLLGVALMVVDQQTGVTVMSAELPSISTSDLSKRTYPLPSTHAAELLLFEYPGEMVDSFILVHLLKVLGLNVDRLLGAADQRARESEQELQNLLAGVATPNLEVLLGGRDVSDGFHMAAFTWKAGAKVTRRLAILGLPVLVGPWREKYHAFIPVDVLSEIRVLSEASDTYVGVSSKFTDARDARVAADEASRILAAARFSGRQWSEFEGSTVAVLTRSQRESEEIIEGVLGPLAGSSAATIKLRVTLFAFLRNDRHWQRTADELGIHRQTLSYRLGRIEEETGRTASRSADLSALWVAYQAWESSRGE